MGFDVDQAKVDRLQAGRSYIKHISGGLDRPVRRRRPLSCPPPTCARLGEADALLICVPTPLNESRDPDLTYVEKTAEQIAAVLRPGQLVVLESTTYPGTTRATSCCRSWQSGGLQAGPDFFLAFSPSAKTRQPNYTARGIPKVVGGIDAPAAGWRNCSTARRWSRSCRSPAAKSPRRAKILENTYRAVNIALVNELKMLYDRMGIDVWEVIDAAKTKPFGFQAFYPGPGLGGHCIPIDPFYLTWLARQARHDDPLHRAGRRDQHARCRST